MKISFLKVFGFLALILFTNCADKAKEAETKGTKETAVAQSTAVTYITDIKKSMIEWEGFKPTGSHSGTIGINVGSIAINNGVIESGNFTINMHSIAVTDIPVEEKGNAKLAGHLKSEDFFDVDTYATAKFEVTDIKTNNGKTMLSGNLTMKNATNNITFPIATKLKEDMVILNSETFTIDRSKWNIKYRSKSFFNDLEDHFINDDIELRVTLIANKA